MDAAKEGLGEMGVVGGKTLTTLAIVKAMSGDKKENYEKVESSVDVLPVDALAKIAMNRDGLKKLFSKEESKESLLRHTFATLFFNCYD